MRGPGWEKDPGFDESVPVDTQPDVVSGNHLYTAPTEITPFSYKIVLDLSIPVPDRCQETMDLIGGNYFAGIFAWGTLGEERILRSLQLFAEQVMPALRVPARVA